MNNELLGEQFKDIDIANVGTKGKWKVLNIQFVSYIQNIKMRKAIKLQSRKITTKIV